MMSRNPISMTVNLEIDLSRLSDKELYDLLSAVEVEIYERDPNFEAIMTVTPKTIY